jgi:hypothetical protein
MNRPLHSTFPSPRFLGFVRCPLIRVIFQLAVAAMAEYRKKRYAQNMDEKWLSRPCAMSEVLSPSEEIAKRYMEIFWKNSTVEI